MMNHTLIIALGISIIFVMTTLGSALVFCFKSISEKFNSLLIGFASGVMLAASIWSLLIPAIDQSLSLGALKFLPAFVGLLLGGLFLFALDRIVPSIGGQKDVASKRVTKLFVAVTVHNIPEGLAVGFALGAALALKTEQAYMAAIGLAIGIAIQNLPEGAAVSLTMKNVTKSRGKAFLIGMGSGSVEPVAAAIGLLLASYIRFLQPWLLSFSAGAMIYVIFDDLMVEAQKVEDSHLGTWGALIGFIVMMTLDVAFS